MKNNITNPSSLAARRHIKNQQQRREAINSIMDDLKLLTCKLNHARMMKDSYKAKLYEEAINARILDWQQIRDGK